MKPLFWIWLITRLVSTTAERKSVVASQSVVGPMETRTQTVNTAPITIHVPFLKNSSTRQQSPAPAAIAHEAPEGTYLIPVTEQSKEQPPTVNLVLNLRLVMDGEKKAEQSEVVVKEPTSAPVLKANSGEYVAHEVNIVTPNTNSNPSPTPAALSIGLQGGINQGEVAEFSTPQGNKPNAPRQPAKNFGVIPSFLLVPKRRVLHNVRSNMKADVPGLPMARFRQQFLFEHNKKRLLHGVSPLVQDQKLNEDAQRLAVELAQQRNTTHSVLRKRVGRGENIALRCSFKGSPLTGARATNLWYDENKKFDWKSKSFSPETERFTQIVWKNTTKVGFGRSKFTDGNGRICFVVVARYEPAAKIGEKILDNVLEPIKANRKTRASIK